MKNNNGSSPLKQPASASVQHQQGLPQHSDTLWNNSSG